MNTFRVAGAVWVAGLLWVLFGLFDAVGAQSRHRPERVWSTAWCEQVGGASAGVVLSDGTVPDCMTGTHAIEVDFARKWYEGVGQALHYARMSGLRPGLLLVVEDVARDCKYIQRARGSVGRMLVLIDGLGLVPLDLWVTGGEC